MGEKNVKINNNKNMPAKKIYFLNGNKVPKHKIPVHAKHLGDNIYRELKTNAKIATRVEEKFYQIKINNENITK